jgi:hypothetical protein
MQCGPLSVSAVSTRTYSVGRPRVSAAHWVTTVLRP